MPSTWSKSDGDRFARAVSLYRAMTGNTHPVEVMSSREILVEPFTAALNRAVAEDVGLAEALEGIQEAEEAIERWVNGVPQEGDAVTIAAFPGTFPIVAKIISSSPDSPSHPARTR